MHELGGISYFPTCAVNVDVANQGKKAVDQANREPNCSNNKSAIYRYGSVESHNPRSTATLHSTSSIDSTGRNIGTTPAMNRLLAD